MSNNCCPITVQPGHSGKRASEAVLLAGKVRANGCSLSMPRERGVQQNDRSLADGAGSSCAAGTADTDYNPATPCVGCEDEWIDVPTCASAGCSCSR